MYHKITNTDGTIVVTQNKVNNVGKDSSNTADVDNFVYDKHMRLLTDGNITINRNTKYTNKNN